MKESLSSIFCFIIQGKGSSWKEFHPENYFVNLFCSRRQCGPVVRALGLHAAAPGSNPVITSGLDLFPVVPDSTLPCFVNSQLVASRQLGFLICFC